MTDLFSATGTARAAYLADLRDFRAGVRRSHIEAYTRQLEQAGRSRATVTRRLATLAGFYRYAVQEGALRHSPATHVRRPSVARDSQTLGLDREEAVRFLAAAQAASARHYLRLGGVRIGAALPHPRGPTRSAFGFLRRARSMTSDPGWGRIAVGQVGQTGSSQSRV